MLTRGAPSTACTIRRQALEPANVSTHGSAPVGTLGMEGAHPNGLPTRSGPTDLTGDAAQVNGEDDLTPSVAAEYPGAAP